MKSFALCTGSVRRARMIARAGANPAVQRTEDIKEAPVIIIRNRQTNVYVGEEKMWTPDPTTARPFENAYHALYFCVSNNLNDTDIVERFPDGREVRFLRC